MRQPTANIRALAHRLTNRHLFFITVLLNSRLLLRDFLGHHRGIRTHYAGKIFLQVVKIVRILGLIDGSVASTVVDALSSICKSQTKAPRFPTLEEESSIVRLIVWS